MRILTYITTEEDAGRAARSVVPRRFQLGTHAFRRLKVEGGILCDGAPHGASPESFRRFRHRHYSRQSVRPQRLRPSLLT